MRSLKVIKRTQIFLLIFVTLVSSSCTTLSFKSYGQFPINIGAKKYHGEISEFIGEKDFYLWGIIPYEHNIYIDDVMKEFDYISIANIEIEEYQTSKNFLLSFLSLGLYVPRNFRIKFYGKK